MVATSLDRQVLQLLEDQKKEWALAGTNYEGLKKVEVKDLPVGAAHFRLQFNPERIISSAAKVDPKSIQERKCFLCQANLPADQRGIPYADGRYVILVNPFPIFHKHLTIPLTEHTEQLMSEDRLCDMLRLAKELPSFSLFYNGPKCGASAPDHFHFQAAEAGVMPVENEYGSCPKTTLAQKDNVRIETIENYVRKVIIITSSDKASLCRVFTKIFDRIGILEPRTPEAMFNLIVRYVDGEWRLFLFPRREHRPCQFFAEGDDKIVFSPASVDFGGLLIFPRKEDFEKMTPQIVRHIFEQVSFSEDKWQLLKQYIQTQH